MLEHLISYYGPIAVFVGAVFEGETAAFLGGVFAHRGLMPYWAAAVAAILGSWVGDQALFYAGRYADRFSIIQRIMHAQKAQRVKSLLAAHPDGFIFSFRFILGMRMISPVIIGLSGVSPMRFFVLNLAAALVWGVTVTGCGYLFGNAIEAAFGHLGLNAVFFFAVGIIAAALAVVAWLSRKTLPKPWSD
jgi:membrane protein DedA with SNARE-associated domain